MVKLGQPHMCAILLAHHPHTPSQGIYFTTSCTSHCTVHESCSQLTAMPHPPPLIPGSKRIRNSTHFDTGKHVSRQPVFWCRLNAVVRKSFLICRNRPETIVNRATSFGLHTWAFCDRSLGKFSPLFSAVKSRTRTTTQVISTPRLWQKKKKKKNFTGKRKTDVLYSASVLASRPEGEPGNCGLKRRLSAPVEINYLTSGWKLISTW